MESIECIFCPGQATVPYKNENGYQAVACTQCGLVYVTPRPTIEEMKQLYEGQETKIDLYGHLRRRDLKCVQAKESLRWIRRYCRSGTLLEVGSAAGYFLWEAKKAGFVVQGVDITHQFVEFSTRVLGVPAFEGTMREAPFEHESFDVIYLRNVLSHLAHPLDEFRRLRTLLKPGGYVVLETGNVAELDPSVPNLLELPDHLYHFSEKTIRLLFERTGFECVEVHRFALLTELRTFKTLERRFQKQPAAKIEQRLSLEMPAEVPASRLAARLGARFGSFIRYDLGRLLPQADRRCTLIAVGRRPR